MKFGRVFFELQLFLLLIKDLYLLYFYSFIFFKFLVSIFQSLYEFQTWVLSTAKLEIWLLHPLCSVMVSQKCCVCSQCTYKA